MHARIAGFAILLLAGATFAQTPHTSKVSVPDDPVVRQTIHRADEALKAGDHDRFAKLLQDILDRSCTKVVDYVRGPRNPDTTDQVVPGDRYRGVQPEIQARLSEAPPGVFARYQEIVEPRAAHALEGALATGVPAALLDVYQRYFLVPSGKKAAVHLADAWLSAGRTEETLALCRRLRGTLAAGDAFLPLLMAREACALMAMGRHAELEAILPAAEKAGEVEVEGTKVRMETFLAALLERTPPSPATPASSRDVDIFRRKMWSNVFDVNTNRETSTYIFHNDARDGDSMPYFPVVPKIRDGHVFLSNGLRLQGWNLLTQEELWPAVPGPQAHFEGRRNHNLRFELTLDRDLVFAHLEGPPIRSGSRAWQGFAPIEPIPSRRLVAVETHTGVVRWSHFAPVSDSPEDVKFLRDLIVNQPPLVRGETLYVAGTVSLGVFHQWVCALERDTGRLRWRTYVGSGQMELNMFGNPIKEAVPGMIEEFDGVLYGATNVGTVYAVAADTGAVLWESAYHQEPIPGSDYTLTMERYPGWAPSRPARHQDRILVAPSDSYHLYAVDMKTGALKVVPGASRTPETMNRYFLGIHGGLAIVSGRTLSAFDPDSLEMKWRSMELQGARHRGQFITGQPAADDQSVFVLSGGDGASLLYVVDVATGRFIRRQEIDASNLIGNLTLSLEAMVVTNEGGLSVFFDLNAVQKRFERLVNEDRRDAASWIGLGGIRLRQGQWRAALDSYYSGLESAEAMGLAGKDYARQARLALYNLWLDLAKRSSTPIVDAPSRPEERFAKALDFAENAEQRVRAMKAAWEWAISARDQAAATRIASRLLSEHRDEVLEFDGAIPALLPDLPSSVRLPVGVMIPLVEAAQAIDRRAIGDAVAAYQRVIETHPDVVVGSETAWSYAGRRIADLISKNGPACYRVQEQAATRLFKEASAAGDVVSLRAVLRRYPQSQVVPGAILEITRRLLADGSYREAKVEMERSLADFRRLDAASLVEIARCLDELGGEDSETQVLRTLDRRFGTQSISVGETTTTAREFARGRLSELGRSGPVAATPSFAGPLKEAWKVEGTDQSAPCEILLPAAGLLQVHLGAEIKAIRPSDGAVAWKRPCLETPMRWFTHDGMALGVIDGDIVCLDAKTGTERWRHRPSDYETLDLNVGHGKVYLLARDFTREVPVSLDVHDIFGGELLRRVLLPGVRGSFASSRPLMVSPGYVLVRDEPGRMAVCLDAFTLEPVSTMTALRGDGTQILLTEQDLLFTVTTSSRALPILTISARAPTERQDTWTFQAGSGSMTLLGLSESHLVVQVVAVSRSRSSGDGAQNRLIAIDLDKLAPALTVPLRPGEFAIPPVKMAEGRLYAQVRIAKASLAERVRAFDIPSGQSPWSSVDFTGSNLIVSSLPTQESLLIRKVTTPRGDPIGASAVLYLLDGSSGAVTDRFELGDSPVGFGSSGMAVMDGVLMVNCGRYVTGLKP